MKFEDFPLVKSLLELRVETPSDLLPLVGAIGLAGITLTVIIYFLSKLLVAAGLVGFLFFVAWLFYNFFKEKA